MLSCSSPTDVRNANVPLAQRWGHIKSFTHRPHLRPFAFPSFNGGLGLIDDVFPVDHGLAAMSDAALDDPRLLNAPVQAAAFAAGIMLICGGARAERIETPPPCHHQVHLIVALVFPNPFPSRSLLQVVSAPLIAP